MKCFLPHFPSEKAVELMRWFGYAAHREDGFMSFVRSPFAPESRFPRFHASVYPIDGGLRVNIHLDQEDIADGQGNHQFVWAYRNPLVLDEGRRLEGFLDQAREKIFFKPPAVSPPTPKVVPRKINSNSTSKKIISFLSKQKILCRLF
ncbi:MAG: hypothetical protein UX09_C0024G0014 [Candidatus Uhrbacteria bacterium GW2011_GWE2_45_35]|uniref:Uncharacterized protein n=2 Tax=Candidatus Uhriibacteriota TaxID=1752732 RepID=A0A0G1J9I3_9BACT|nr:MAG: hypothetical protein UW63_C0089G0009 [Candidatus Uhrbacteria bacterium GW2011_GWF2_44_350]KKU07789.1 MAG: hypothetical protein UX09_C0024G0014 [Candidatus Uhrbacteria bacterium GW2011_GWE2_45_35]HBR81042.1 hypothetical protein [Candidatus Uhrbacteria bacterium]HCU32056.1 hypothetical protein [Candidatus Uhrbacteria bacterium]